MDQPTPHSSGSARSATAFGVLKVITFEEHYLQVRVTGRRTFTTDRLKATAFPDFREALAAARLMGGLVVELRDGQQLLHIDD